MASDAHERARQRLEQPSEALLAELITREAALRQEAAAEHGLTALLRKPPQRERPNERFLQGTLRSVAFANRRHQEDAMWGARRRQLGGHDERRDSGTRRPRLEQQRRRSRSASERSSDGSGSGSASDSDSSAPGAELRPGGEGALGDAALSEMLSKRRVRGRGAVGPRADEPGPYLPAAAAPAYPLLFDDSPLLAARPAAGPARPAWLPRDAEVGPSNGAGGHAVAAQLPRDTGAGATYQLSAAAASAAASQRAVLPAGGSPMSKAAAKAERKRRRAERRARKEEKRRKRAKKRRKGEE